MADYLLSAQGLSCVRGERELFNQLDFAIQPGELLHVRGPNGCGKTSLLRILAGLLLASEGQVCYQGARIESSSHYRNESYFIGHKTAVKNRLTVLENLQLQTQVFNPIDLATKDFNSLLAFFNLTSLQMLLGQSLSAGQRQRVALTRLLMVSAKIWLLDEPLTALDTHGIAKVHVLIGQHLKRGGAVILSSHQALSTGQFNVNVLELNA